MGAGGDPVPDASMMVESINLANPVLTLESDSFLPPNPGLFSFTATVYTDQTRSTVLAKHQQYMPWKTAPTDDAKLRELFASARKENEYRQQDLQLQQQQQQQQTQLDL
jgi:hypothetical protein